MNNEQDDCKYCHLPAKPLLKYSDVRGIEQEFYIDKNDLFVDGTICVRLKANYCLMCGRKLNDD